MEIADMCKPSPYSQGGCSLPCDASSTIFLRIQSDRMDCLQVLISGPEDTPYSLGLFIFDVLFPSEYPQGPPKVNLQTTGYGSVRFNPNLYNCGKVSVHFLFNPMDNY